MDTPILSVKDICKYYPGVRALNKVSFDVKCGEVHALVGENGAGKSTLIKVITGAITPDSGEIEVEGQKYSAMTPHLSSSLGIEAIYQEFNLAPTLSVAENIYIGQKNGKSKHLMDYKTLYADAQKVIDRLQVQIDPKEKAKNLTVAYQQLTEIAKAIARNAKILIMDEPTAPLTDDEVAVLLKLVNSLKADGVAIIYISHRLNELPEICDRVTIMRDGATVVTKPMGELTRESIIQYMVGRELIETYPRRGHTIGDLAMMVSHISGNGVRDISFELHRGEVLGFAGLVGAGRTELMRVLFGAEKMECGEIWLDGKQIHIANPRDAVRYGIAYVPEDRKQQGAILKQSIRFNITIPIIKKLSRFGVVDNRKAKKLADEYARSVTVKAPNNEQLVMNLSGGNQQKVVISKWLACQPKVLILDEPTRGIDVGAKFEIYTLINRLASEGMAIIIVSSEMEEIIGMSDRIIVLCEGEQAGELKREEFSQERILHYASGNK